jgi:hypothetical protein
MNRYKLARRFIRTLITLSVSAGAAMAEEKVHEQTLFVDKPVTYQGVVVTWIEDGPTNTENAGAVVFQASGERFQYQMDWNHRLVFAISGTSFQIDPSKSNETLFLRGWEVEDELDLQAVPTEKFTAWISPSSPLRLNDLILELVGEEPGEPKIRVKNRITGETEESPIVEHALVQFGRFRIQVYAYYENTLTAELGISAEVDETVKGRGAAYARGDLREFGEMNLEGWMDRFSERYGFKVEYDIPEALEAPFRKLNTNEIEIDRVFNHDRNRSLLSGRSPYGTLGELTGLFENFYSDLKFTWEDKTHLTIGFADAEERIADMEREKKVADDIDRLRRVLQEDYELETKIYPLQEISSDAAVRFIEPELNTYQLRVRDNSIVEIVENEERTGPGPITPIEGVRELIVPDPVSNSIIVTAASGTHAKVGEILSAIEQLRNEDNQGQLTLYQVEIALLRGVETGERIVDGTPEYMTGLNTPVESMQVGHQSVADLASLLSEYGQLNIQVDPDLITKVSLNLQKPLTIGEILHLLEEVYGIETYYGKKSVILRRARGDGNTGRDASSYGLTKEDLSPFGVNAVEEIGRGVVSLIPEEGDTGSASLLLGDRYQCEVAYQDTREPYLVVRGTVSEIPQNAEGQEKDLMSNTLFLKPGEPSLLGVTNLREALMLVVVLKP